MSYALILNGVIQNIVTGNADKCAAYARSVYGSTAIAVCCEKYAVQKGDTYSDGKFYRTENGITKEIPRIE